MHRTRSSRTARLACAVGAATLALAAPAAGDAVDLAPYSLQVSALTGPQGGLLRIEVEAVAGVPGVSSLRYVQVSVDGVLIRVLRDVAAPDGVAEIDLGPVARGATVSANVQVRLPTSGTLVQLRRAALARLRPDLVVAGVHAPLQTLSTRPVDVVADVTELNGDVGATATLTLMLGPTPLAEPKTVTVPKGGDISSTFEDVKLETPMSAELTVLIDGAVPFETDATNNSRTRTVEVTEHELVRSNVLVPSLGGYGAQFNQHVYAPITNAPPASLPEMEELAKDLEPQLVRIFYNDNWEERMPTAPQNFASFEKTVKLAHDAGATINITYHAVNIAKLTPSSAMARFAGVLEDLVEVDGLTNVRWVTIANEPNSTGLTLPEYNALYRALHAELVARGLREQIKLMGGDLIEGLVGTANDHRVWWQFMAQNMNDILDAYSVHIYWTYHDVPRMEFRLRDVYKVITEELPAEARKPTYVMEFAVRGRDPFPSKPIPRYAFYDDGTDMRRTNIAGFQTLWFFLESAQLGYTGTAKWDAYWGLYDNSSANNQSYWMTGSAAEGWPLLPTYHSLHLLLETTQRGWEVVQVAPWEEDDWKVGVPDQPEKELAAYTAADSSITVMGLDSHGRELNTVSGEPPSSYSIGGLPANTAFNLALWNATGNGENSLAGTVTTDAAGVARFEVPVHAAFSLTTVPVS
jgi:hypothetical protein